MAKINSNTENPANPTVPKWPSMPEGLLEFVPDDLNGSPYHMLLNLLTQAHGVVTLLCAEFMGEGQYRPKDIDIVGAIWTAQSQLHLALELMERLDIVES
jgi:hypothetical protein